jgi:ABC-type antimicrobial peptide transport system permease subunit
MRTTLPPAALANSVLRTLRDLNPNQPAAEFRPIQMLVDHANSPRRFFMMLVAAFATLGMLLAALGIYGLISYSVTRRTQEIGIRMALGASAGMVQRHVLAGTLRLAITGIVIGTVASLGVARIIASLLFETSPWDLATYAVMALALFSVAAMSAPPTLTPWMHCGPIEATTRCDALERDDRRPGRARFGKRVRSLQDRLPGSVTGLLYRRGKGLT